VNFRYLFAGKSKPVTHTISTQIHN